MSPSLSILSLPTFLLRQFQLLHWFIGGQKFFQTLGCCSSSKSGQARGDFAKMLDILSLDCFPYLQTLLCTQPYMFATQQTPLYPPSALKIPSWSLVSTYLQEPIWEDDALPPRRGTEVY
jgi:hypothetical protein